jgi:hypothetical protein
VGDDEAAASHYARGVHLFRAWERKDEIGGAISELRYRHSMAGEAESVDGDLVYA